MFQGDPVTIGLASMARVGSPQLLLPSQFRRVVCPVCSAAFVVLMDVLCFQGDSQLDGTRGFILDSIVCAWPVGSGFHTMPELPPEPPRV